MGVLSAAAEGWRTSAMQQVPKWVCMIHRRKLLFETIGRKLEVNFSEGRHYFCCPQQPAAWWVGGWMCWTRQTMHSLNLNLFGHKIYEIPQSDGRKVGMLRFGMLGYPNYRITNDAIFLQDSSLKIRPNNIPVRIKVSFPSVSVR